MCLQYRYSPITPTLHTKEDISTLLSLWKYFYKSLLTSHPQLVMEEAAIFIKQFIKTNLSNSKSRKLLQLLLTSNPHIGNWIVENAPNILFLLCSMRERRILQLLINNNLAARSVLDREGNNLLSYVSGCRGRTERIVEMLVRGGWEVGHVNNKGESARSRAANIKHWGMWRSYEDIPGELSSHPILVP